MTSSGRGSRVAVGLGRVVLVLVGVRVVVGDGVLVYVVVGLAVGGMGDGVGLVVRVVVGAAVVCVISREGVTSTDPEQAAITAASRRSRKRRNTLNGIFISFIVTKIPSPWFQLDQSVGDMIRSSVPEFPVGFSKMRRMATPIMISRLPANCIAVNLSPSRK